MVDNVKLKKGIVVEFEGKSYMILDISLYFYALTNEEHSIHIKPKQVLCKYCKGNLKKMGTKKGQYKCEKCNRPNWLDERGEHVEA